MGDGDCRPPGNGNRHGHTPQHWKPGSMCVYAGWGRSLQTQRSLEQLLPSAACVESSHLSMRLLQVRPIHVGFLVFRVIYVRTLQPHFRIESWDYPVCRVGHMFTCCAAVWVCVILHVFHACVHFGATPLASLSIIAGGLACCQTMLHSTSVHKPLPD